jgi:hypothetical protein
MAVKKWNGASFTGQNRVRCPESQWVCEPCVYFTARLSPVPGRPPKPGKKLGGNYRNYSHCYDSGEYFNASKGEKPSVLEFLQQPHGEQWFAAIADSGQKHVLPWTPVNTTTSSMVLFDEALIRVPPSGAMGWLLIPHMANLLTAGVTKAELESQQYSSRSWLACRSDIAEFEQQYGSLRTSSWFGLALWLAQRDEEEVKRREAKRKANRKAKNKDCRASIGAEKGLSADARLQPVEALGAAPKQNAKRSKKKRKPGRMGNQDATGATDHRTGQIRLPGFD